MGSDGIVTAAIERARTNGSVKREIFSKHDRARAASISRRVVAWMSPSPRAMTRSNAPNWRKFVARFHIARRGLRATGPTLRTAPRRCGSHLGGCPLGSCSLRIVLPIAMRRSPAWGGTGISNPARVGPRVRTSRAQRSERVPTRHVPARAPRAPRGAQRSASDRRAAPETHRAAPRRAARSSAPNKGTRRPR